jgi:hypothetical protein
MFLEIILSLFSIGALIYSSTTVFSITLVFSIISGFTSSFFTSLLFQFCSKLAFNQSGTFSCLFSVVIVLSSMLSIKKGSFTKSLTSSFTNSFISHHVHQSLPFFINFVLSMINSSKDFELSLNTNLKYNQNHKITSHIISIKNIIPIARPFKSHKTVLKNHLFSSIGVVVQVFSSVRVSQLISIFNISLKSHFSLVVIILSL